MPLHHPQIHSVQIYHKPGKLIIADATVDPPHRIDLLADMDWNLGATPTSASQAQPIRNVPTAGNKFLAPPPHWFQRSKPLETRQPAFLLRTGPLGGKRIQHSGKARITNRRAEAGLVHIHSIPSTPPSLLRRQVQVGERHISPKLPIRPTRRSCLSERHIRHLPLHHRLAKSPLIFGEAVIDTWSCPASEVAVLSCPFGLTMHVLCPFVSLGLIAVCDVFGGAGLLCCGQRSSAYHCPSWLSCSGNEKASTETWTS
ncbi:hypothetical protein B0H63DRAFT_193852 [Podospora didyma]|uniref:Uncharacterized protein n=1 Tax=Podospora didyma TaxID=330526 RepID=A0AAE0NG95_9PEZI|nr:hypothetical protein B0H63DRAFT_193852 [Podospora didyma]